jgi:hypothetical protein
MRIVLDARLADEPFAQAAKGLARLVARLKALRGAVRGNNFRTAQGLRLALPLYVRRVKGRVRNDLLRLFEVSGFWVRNVGDRRQTKRSALQIIRRIISRLRIPASGSVADANLALVPS